MRPQPHVVVDIYTTCNAFLIENRSVRAFVFMVSSDEIGIGSNQRIFTKSYLASRKNLAVKTNVRTIINNDVTVFATENRVATDEDPVSNRNPYIGRAFGIEDTSIINDNVVSN